MFQIPSAPADGARCSDHDLGPFHAGGCGRELKAGIFRTGGGASAAVTVVSQAPLTVPFALVMPPFTARFRRSRLRDPQPEGSG
jgi:hypothetical protein